jgi:hypothetical protein
MPGDLPTTIDAIDAQVVTTIPSRPELWRELNVDEVTTACTNRTTSHARIPSARIQDVQRVLAAVDDQVAGIATVITAYRRIVEAQRAIIADLRRQITGEIEQDDEELLQFDALLETMNNTVDVIQCAELFEQMTTVFRRTMDNDDQARDSTSQTGRIASRRSFQDSRLVALQKRTFHTLESIVATSRGNVRDCSQRVLEMQRRLEREEEQVVRRIANIGEEKTNKMKGVMGEVRQRRRMDLIMRVKEMIARQVPSEMKGTSVIFRAGIAATRSPIAGDHRDSHSLPADHHAPSLSRTARVHPATNRGDDRGGIASATRWTQSDDHSEGERGERVQALPQPGRLQLADLAGELASADDLDSAIDRLWRTRASLIVRRALLLGAAGRSSKKCL